MLQSIKPHLSCENVQYNLKLKPIIVWILTNMNKIKNLIKITN